jgi:DNA-directed RNA polymerase subunit RPC12/RpoP
VRVPWSRIYRAFPELDPFSDEECERYILQVRQQKFGQWKYRMLAFWLVVSWLILVFPVAMWIAHKYRLETMGMVLGFFIAMPLGVFFPTAFYRDRLLIAAIRGRLNLARCTRCRHSLLGLPLLGEMEQDAVRCPECGSVMVLSDLGLRHRELIPRQEPPGEPPPGPPDAHPAPHA